MMPKDDGATLERESKKITGHTQTIDSTESWFKFLNNRLWIKNKY